MHRKSRNISRPESRLDVRMWINFFESILFDSFTSLVKTKFTRTMYILRHFQLVSGELQAFLRLVEMAFRQLKGNYLDWKLITF